MKVNRFFFVSILFVFLVCVATESYAIPTFARKYKTSCSTCHYAFPKLNAFGKAFKNNGFRYPEGQDAEMTKEEPVSLGSEGYKRVFPDAIWPTDMPGSVPLSFMVIGRFHLGGKFDDPTTPAVEEDKLASFEIPHEYEMFFAGTLDDHLSYFGELEWEHESEFAYEFSVQYDFSPRLHLRLGSVGLQASPEHFRLTREHYNVVDLKTQSGEWRMRSGAGAGLELWGAGNGAGGRGGYTYAVGLGNGQNDEDNFDVNKEKDIYARVTYKIGGLGEIGGTEGGTSETSAFYVDNSVRFGGFMHSGTALSGADNDEFSVIGADVDWWFNRLNVVALGMRMTSDYLGYERKSLAFMLEGNYVIYPWLIAHARYESTDADTDLDSVESVNSLIPSLIFMIRANAKCSFEYKMPLDDASKDAKKGRFTFQFNLAL